MAQKKNTVKNVSEAARAAGLAAHSAAGLATAASCREAARLLRSAEALARSAVAVLNSSPTTSSTSTARNPGVDNPKEVIPPSGGATPKVIPPRCATLHGDARPPDAVARKHRRRRKKSKKPCDRSDGAPPAGNGGHTACAAISPVEGSDQTNVMEVDDSGQTPSAVTPRDGRRGLPLSAPPNTRVLARHETLPTCPISHSVLASSFTFPLSSPPTAGSVHILCGLTARPELNGKRVRFQRVSDDGARFIVEFEQESGDPIRVKSSNLLPLDPRHVQFPSLTQTEASPMEMEQDVRPARASGPVVRKKDKGKK